MSATAFAPAIALVPWMDVAGARATFTEFFVTATPVVCCGQQLVRYEVFAGFNGPTDTLLNAFNLSLTSGPAGGFWHKDSAYYNSGVCMQEFGSWNPAQTSAANRPCDSFVRIGCCSTSTDPNWQAGSNWSGSGSVMYPAPPQSWFNANPVTPPGCSRSGGCNPPNGVFVAQLVLSADAPPRTYSLTISYNNGVPGSSVQFATSTFTLCGAETTWYRDLDGDGIGSAIHGTLTQCEQPPGYVATGGDNCPFVANPRQDDTDGDGIGDACDACGPIRVPQDYKTIQAAIAAVDPACSTRIEVAAGVYQGPIDFAGRDLQIVGSGPDTCIITGLGAAASVVQGTREPPSALLEGFTIRDGGTGSPLPAQPDALCGGGMLLVESALRVRNCRFVSNEAVFGGGIYLYRASATFEDCAFIDNLAQARAGGADVFECSARFTRCEFRGNQSAIGAGVQAYRGQPTFENTTIHFNGAFDVGGGVQWYPIDETALLVLRDCHISANSAPIGSGLSMYEGGVASRTQLPGTTVCGNLPRNVIGRYTPDAATVVCDCPADVVFDGVVGGADLALVLDTWGVPTDPLTETDLNGDGIVNGADLALVLVSWGSCASE